MEFVVKYRPILKNEVVVSKPRLVELFKNKRVFVLGYGSLTHSFGWAGRCMRRTPKKRDLIECEVRGFERGPFGLMSLGSLGVGHAYYGVIRTPGKRLNGVLGPVLDLADWAYLMRTECIAGLTRYVNYRVVDVTDCVFRSDGKKLPKNSVVHMVVNRPANREKLKKGVWRPRAYYYDDCWAGIIRERSTQFQDEFLKSGGVKSDEEAIYVIKEHRRN